jgi:hypothetical protein
VFPTKHFEAGAVLADVSLVKNTDFPQRNHLALFRRRKDEAKEEEHLADE